MRGFPGSAVKLCGPGWFGAELAERGYVVIAPDARVELIEGEIDFITLFDAQGQAIPVTPDYINIVHGITISDPPLSRSIGNLEARLGVTLLARTRRKVELTPEGNRLIAHSNGMRIGVVEPRVAARLLKLIADGNKYSAGVTSLGDKDVRIILREIFQDPANYGKVSFPTAAKSTDLRPYTKGTLVREEMDLEDDLEDDEEDDEIEDLDRVLPPEATTDEAFEDEPDELDDDPSALDLRTHPDDLPAMVAAYQGLYDRCRAVDG